MGGICLLEVLSDPGSRVVGVHEVLKAVSSGEAKQVFIAGDADPKLVKPLYKVCEEKSVPLIIVGTKDELGRASGLRVGAAAAAEVLKPRGR